MNTRLKQIVMAGIIMMLPLIGLAQSATQGAASGPNNVYIEQNFASKYHNCIEGNVNEYIGTVALDPPGTLSPSVTKVPDIVNNIDKNLNEIYLLKKENLELRFHQKLIINKTIDLILDNNKNILF